MTTLRRRPSPSSRQFTSSAQLLFCLPLFHANQKYHRTREGSSDIGLTRVDHGGCAVWQNISINTHWVVQPEMHNGAPDLGVCPVKVDRLLVSGCDPDRPAASLLG